MTTDKLYHFTAGWWLACMGLLHSPLAAIALATAAGIGKEVYDRVTRRGTPELADAIYTVLGGLPPVVAWLAWLAYRWEL